MEKQYFNAPNLSMLWYIVLWQFLQFFKVLHVW